MKGEFVFVIGSTGCGKSTLIKMLYREEKPTSGKILIDGLNVGKLKIIPENYNMYCELFTLLEEIGGSKYRDFASVSEFFYSKIAEKKFGHLQKKYPNINATVTYDELKSALQEANILKLEQGRYALDIDGYQNYIECERVRDEVIQEEKTVYRAIENDFSVPDVELQKARVKVKEMINRNV